MKKLLYLLLLTPIIYLASCSSSPDLSPTTTSLHGTWQYDSWLLDGNELLNDYVSYLNICEDSGYWATQIFDIEGNMTSNSQAGSFTINDDQTEGVFTVELVYEAINGWLILDLPQTFSVSIYKLDDNELDFSFQYAGHTEIIESVKTLTEPTCSYTLAAVVSGCTDSLATNYNPLATIDDGSCEYPAVLDCMGVPNGLAAVDDCGDCHQSYVYQGMGVVTFIAMLADTAGLDGMLVIAGSAEDIASNPNWNASCYGCIDPLAINWNPTAIFDDGSCNYTSDVVFYLDLAAAVYFDNLGINYLEVYVENNFLGQLNANIGHTSAPNCLPQPDAITSVIEWQGSGSSTFNWEVRDITGIIQYSGTDLILANECHRIQMTAK